MKLLVRDLLVSELAIIPQSVKVSVPGRPEQQKNYVPNINIADISARL